MDDLEVNLANPGDRLRIIQAAVALASQSDASDRWDKTEHGLDAYTVLDEILDGPTAAADNPEMYLGWIFNSAKEIEAWRDLVSELTTCIQPYLPINYLRAEQALGDPRHRSRVVASARRFVQAMTP
jgi:hypothetical protein